MTAALPPEIGAEQFASWVEVLSALTGLALEANDPHARGVPVVVNGEPVAALSAAGGSDSPRLSLSASLLASLCESQMARRDLVAQTARLWKELNFLTGVATALTATATPEETAARLLARIVRLLGVSRASILLARDDGQLVVAAARGVALNVAVGTVVPPGGIADRVFRSGEPILVEDVDRLDGDVEVAALLHREARTGSFLSVPIVAGGTPVGVINMTDRSGDLPFRAGDLKLITALANQAGIAFANVKLLSEVRRAEALKHELDLAGRIQRSLVAQRPVVLPGLTAHGVCEPAAWVGGDSLQAAPRADGGLWAAVCDVSGHGISAALLMASAHAALRAIMAADLPPSEAARALNDLVGADAGDTGMFLTAALLRVDPDGRARLTSLGHPAAIVVRADGTAETFRSGGAPAGILPDERYEEDELSLRPGDRLLLHTDGLTEAEGPTGPVGEERLTSWLAGRPAGEDAEATAHGLLASLGAHTCGRPLKDDVALLVVTRTGEA